MITLCVVIITLDIVAAKNNYMIIYDNYHYFFANACIHNANKIIISLQFLNLNSPIQLQLLHHSQLSIDCHCHRPERFQLN